ncbi:unnamed protein product [Prorocentrum cordatum]|uniref:Peroxin-7 n=1 Tax=Prorocentrum cordatum TaxID=2364126 RepID=A0ABN9TI36_9DINO|nr:unnamed protein product [Polarella glacialis]
MGKEFGTATPICSYSEDLGFVSLDVDWESCNAVCGSRSQLRLCSLRSGAHAAPVEVAPGLVWQLAVDWSRPGPRVLRGEGPPRCELRVHDVAAGAAACGPAMAGHRGTPAAVAADWAAARAVSGGNDHAVRIWDLSRSAPLASMAGHHGPVWCVQVDMQAMQAITGAGDHTVQLWDPRWRQMQYAAAGESWDCPQCNIKGKWAKLDADLKRLQKQLNEEKAKTKELANKDSKLDKARPASRDDMDADDEDIEPSDLQALRWELRQLEASEDKHTGVQAAADELRAKIAKHVNAQQAALFEKQRERAKLLERQAEEANKQQLDAKGAADFIGQTLKRCADWVVLEGADNEQFQQALASMQAALAQAASVQHDAGANEAHLTGETDELQRCQRQKEGARAFFAAAAWGRHRLISMCRSTNIEAYCMPLAALTRTPPLAASGFSDGTAVVVQAGLALAEPGVPGFANVMSGRAVAKLGYSAQLAPGEALQAAEDLEASGLKRKQALPEDCLFDAHGTLAPPGPKVEFLDLLLRADLLHNVSLQTNVAPLEF